MKELLFVLSFLFSINGISAQPKPQTFCNPLNLNYNFTSVGGTNHRTAADPVMTLDDNLSGWMLLSSNKKATASSTLENRPLENAFDEDIRTVWSAKTAESG